jgi:hypothetical protein
MVPGYPYAWWIIPVDAFPRLETCLVDQHLHQNLLLVDESTLPGRISGRNYCPVIVFEMTSNNTAHICINRVMLQIILLSCWSNIDSCFVTSYV